MNRSEEIAVLLEQKIRSGEISGKLPSEKELAAGFAVANMTMARAMDILKGKGLIRQVPRRGTFAEMPQKKVIRLYNNSYFASQHKELLIHGIEDVTLETVSELSDADIAVLASTIPMHYSSHFLPYPPELLNALKASGKFYDKVFEFHHISAPTYAVAYSFSPWLLAYNKKLMREFYPEFDPYKFTCCNLVHLLEKLPEDVLPSRKCGNILLLTMAYAAGSLEKALPDFLKLKLSDRNQDFSNKVIFKFVNRNDMTANKISDDYNLMPVADYARKRCCHAASEALFVTHNARYPELAFKIAANTLSDHFQQRVAAHRGNLPANCALAASTMDSRVFRDDIFFNEISNIHYIREIVSPMSAAVVLMGMKKLFRNLITTDEFFNLLNEEKVLIRRREQAIKRVMQTNLGI